MNPDDDLALLLQEFWSRARLDPDTPAPEELPEAEVEIVRALERNFRAPAIDQDFVAGLRARLQDAAAPATLPTRPSPAQSRSPVRRDADGRAAETTDHRPQRLTMGVSPNHTQRRGRAVVPFVSRRPWGLGLAGLGVAAALVLAVVISPLGDQVAPVSAAEVLRRAELAATAPAQSGFYNFVVTEMSEIRAPDAENGDQVIRSTITRWFEQPGRWRREVTSTVTGPDGETVSAGGLTTVSDGKQVWIHRLRDNQVTVKPVGTVSSSGELGPFPEVTGGLSSLLDEATRCYNPRVVGAASIAGRDAIVIDLGASRCSTDSVAEPVSEWTIWVDRATYLILKSVQDVNGQPFAITTVTSISYNQGIDPATFTFTPPIDAKPRGTKTAPPINPVRSNP